MKPLLLAIKAPLGGGKSTVANYLVKQHNFRRVSFAEPLKVEVFEALRTQQFPNEIIDRFGDGVFDLSRPDPMFSGDQVLWVNNHRDQLRALLQYWGTEYRRGQNEDYWVDKFETTVRQYGQEHCSVVTDDCRFPNEKAKVLAMHGQIVWVNTPPDKIYDNLFNRDGTVNTGIVGHASEADNDPNDPSISYILDNTKDLAHLEWRTDLMIESMLRENSTLRSGPQERPVAN